MGRKVFSSTIYKLAFKEAGIKKDPECKSSDMVKLALLLGYHPVFQEEVVEIRRKYGISKLYSIKGSRGIENTACGLIANVKELNEEPKSIETWVECDTYNILKKHCLQANWWFPILIKVYTDILYIPPDYGTFHYYTPKPHEQIEDLDFYIKDAFSGLWATPAIFISENIDSKDKLKLWIDKKWDKLIKPSLAGLNRRKLIKADLDRLALALVIYSWRQRGWSWDKIESWLIHLNDKEDSLFTNYSGVPTRQELQKLSFEAEEKLNSFYPL